MTKTQEIRLAQNDAGGSPATPGGPATATIASLSDQDWYVSRTYGVFHIPACPKGQPYALLILTARGDALDLGDSRRFPFTISAREIAQDLTQDLENHGIFVCAGARPTEQELAAAAGRRDAWYQQLVLEGDQMWARGHSLREISDMHRRASLALGLDRPWASVPQKMAECPACGEKIKVGVALCKHCGAILDAEKAARHGLGVPPEEKVSGLPVEAIGRGGSAEDSKGNGSTHAQAAARGRKSREGRE